MSVTREFPTGVVLSLATGIGMAKMTMGDLHQLMGFLSGGALFNHQMEAVFEEASRAAQAALGEHWRPLAEGEDPAAYAAGMIAVIGPVMALQPAEKPFHRDDAVIADAVELFGGDPSGVKVIAR